MVSTVKPKASATPANPMPRPGNAAAKMALPHPPKTSQNVPKHSANARLESFKRNPPRTLSYGGLSWIPPAAIHRECTRHFNGKARQKGR
jgi:hypothetical protein